MSEASTGGKFRVGALVEVLDLGKAGHVRIPYYIRGRTGRVAQHCGVYLNPEDLALGRSSGPAVHLYRVEFDQRSLWPEDGHPAGDRLVIEIYEHWLRLASAAPCAKSASERTADDQSSRS